MENREAGGTVEMNMKNFTVKNFTGCLLGGAIGDALGYPVEFKSINGIRSVYGNMGIRDFSDIDEVRISDDTQMTLFTANGLLCSAAEDRRGKRSDLLRNLYAAYTDWLRTQEIKSIPAVKPVSWLLSVPELRHTRGPGNTCLSALAGGVAGSIGSPINDSKGCGGIMRSAPVGLYCAYPVEAIRTAADASALTHGNPLGYIPSAVFAYIINRIIYSDKELIDIIEDSMKMLRVHFAEYETAILKITELLTMAIGLVSFNGDGDEAKRAAADAENIECLGGGWVAEETLAIAVYCSLKYEDDFEKAIEAAVNHSGDSDSTGNLVGSILGAIMGEDGLPAKFTDRLELYDIIKEIGQDLYAACPIQDGRIPDITAWNRKYNIYN